MNANLQHLNHTQLCDLLLAGHLLRAEQNHILQDVADDAQVDAHREHLRECLICSAEFEVLRSSDVTAGERLRVGVDGRTVRVWGEVESVDVLNDLLGLIGDVPGVHGVIHQVEIPGW